MTLLYLHSNCCSPSVICAQKKIFISKRETRSRGQRDSGGEWGKDVERSKQQIKSPVSSHAACVTLERLYETVQILTISPFSNSVSIPWPYYLLVCLSDCAVCSLNIEFDNSIAEPPPSEWALLSSRSKHQYLHETLQWFTDLCWALTMWTILLINSVSV